MATDRMTTAQAVIAFLKQQHVERDGQSNPFFDGCFGIFGHGNVAGIGQALQEHLDFRYYQCRNEQGMVHAAAAFAKMKNRMQTLVCTSSIGPGATNMVTGAAVATINRLPVLLLPGDIFARRNVAPVLQQLESEHSQDVSVNDCFRPVSRYWDRINRPDQIITALPEAMRVLTSPVDTGAVTLSLPQDVQTEAFDYPSALFNPRVWHIPRNRPDEAAVGRAANWILACKRPLIIAGGGVHYSDATDALRAFVARTGIPVGETHAGKGSLQYDDPMCLGAIGVTGTSAANGIARQADLVIGIGTRFSDFTTASKTQFKADDVRFININVAEFDAFKHSAVPLIGDARASLADLGEALGDFSTDHAYRAECRMRSTAWDSEVQRIYSVRHSPLPSQGEIIGLVNELGDPEGVMVCAAGSLPGDLHKLWRTRHPKQYHMEYGYSTMGYEIAGGMGIKMADPDREVYVLVGDGSYLMLSSDLVTAVQEGYKLTLVLMDNHGYKSIGALSRSLGQSGFGTRFAYRESGVLPGDKNAEVNTLPVDLATNAESLGALVYKCVTADDVAEAIRGSASSDRTCVIYVQTDRYEDVPGLRQLVGCPGGRNQYDGGCAGGKACMGNRARAGAIFFVIVAHKFDASSSGATWMHNRVAGSHGALALIGRGIKPAKAPRFGGVSVLLLTAFMLFWQAACSPDGEEAEERELRVVFVTHGQASDPFWSVVQRGARMAGQELGVRVEYQAPESFDIVTMAQLIDAAVASMPDGLVVSIPDSGALGPALRSARDAGIPVISVNSGSEAATDLGSLVHVGQTEFEAGYAAGRRFAMSGVQKAICVNQEVGNLSLDNRCDGFGAALGEAGATMELLAAELTDPTESQQRIEAALRADPAIDGLLTLGPTGAVPALKALSEGGHTDRVAFATFDASPEILQGIEDGAIEFAIDQQQYMQGYLPVVLLALYHRNENLLAHEVLRDRAGLYHFR